MTRSNGKRFCMVVFGDLDVIGQPGPHDKMMSIEAHLKSKHVKVFDSDFSATACGWFEVMYFFRVKIKWFDAHQLITGGTCKVKDISTGQTLPIQAVVRDC